MARAKRKICGTGEKEIVVSEPRARFILYCVQHALNTACGGMSNAERMAKKIGKELSEVFPGVYPDIPKED